MTKDERRAGSHSTRARRFKVIVVGAGPTGCIAAYRLAQAGVDVLLLEQNQHCVEDMRASTLHAPTLDMFAELGLLGPLEAQGLRAPIYHYRNRATGNLITLDLSEISDVSAHPYRLQCEQFKISRLVTGLLAAHDHAQVMFSRRAVFVEQGSTGVTLHVESPTALETFRSDYLIGADGANSLIRKWTGAEFEGFTYPERFLTLSTRYPIERDYDHLALVNYVANGEDWRVLLRVPEFWRILAPCRSEESDADLLSDAKTLEVFSSIVADARAVETHHRTVYRVHQRVADSYRHGRVLLAGDAAHLNNPLGGFGLNSGVHDVWNLTEKLIAILTDGADADALLDRYDRQRRTVMREFVQVQTIRNKKMLEAGADGQRTQEQQLAAIVADDKQRRDYLLTQSMYRSREREAEIE